MINNTDYDEEINILKEYILDKRDPTFKYLNTIFSECSKSTVNFNIFKQTYLYHQGSILGYYELISYMSPRVYLDEKYFKKIESLCENQYDELETLYTIQKLLKKHFKLNISVYNIKKINAITDETNI